MITFMLLSVDMKVDNKYGNKLTKEIKYDYSKS